MVIERLLYKRNKSFLFIISILLLVSLLNPVIVEAKTGYTLQGWRKDQNKWTGGNIYTYYEDEWANYRLKVTRYDGADLTICVQHDYFDGSTLGVDETRNWFIGASVNTTTPPEDITPIFLQGSVFTVSGPTYINKTNKDMIEYCFHITNSTPLMALSDFTFYWEAHLANGSSQWNGASLHARTNVTGNQDVPIKIPPSPGAAEVDLTLDKTGPLNASIGETITYTYNVSNLESNPAYNITVEDNRCGIAHYTSGDDNDNDALDQGEFWIFECNYTLNASDPDPLINAATVSTTNTDVNGTNNDDSWEVDILRTDVLLEKTGPLYAHTGDEITYTFTIENTGETTLNLTSMNDDVLGELTAELPENLEAGGIYDFNIQYNMTDDTENLAELWAENLYGEDGLYVNDSHQVDVLNPGIAVNKTADKVEAHELDNVTYSFNITNTGDAPLYNVTVYDSILGLVYAGSLEVGEQRTIVFQIPIGAPDPLVNNVTARGEDALGLEVNYTDSWTIDVLHPSINVIKTGNTSAIDPPGWVNYTIFVENNGDATLYDVTLDDPKIDLNNYTVGDLAPEENQTIYQVYQVTRDDSDPLINQVNATAEDSLGMGVNDTDTWLVDLLNPDINVTKTANTTIAHVGDVIEYTINVTNPGDTLLNITLDDPPLGYNEAYNNLDAGESHIFSVNYTIKLDDPDPLINVVNVTGVNDTIVVRDNSSWVIDILKPDITVYKTATHPVVCSEYCNGTYIIAVKNTGDTMLYNLSLVDDLFGSPSSLPNSLEPDEVFSWEFNQTLTGDTMNNVTATGEDVLNKTVTSEDSAFIDFINPSIEVTKSTNVSTIHPGDPVEYNYTVKNTGDDPLKDVTLIDDQYDLSHESVDLDVGENFTETRVMHLTENTTNTATVTGINSLNNTVEDKDNASIIVLYPRIEVNKTGPIRAPEGETVTYTITVRNTGDTLLTSVNITDSILGDLEEKLELQLGEAITLNPTYTIPHPYPSTDLNNTVTVVGRDELGLVVSNSSSWSIVVPHPSITIEKTAPKAAYQGSTITYNITITNTGDVGLFNVKIIDPVLGINHTMLGPFTGTTKLYKDFVVPFTDSNAITNTANVTSICCIGTLVNDTDTARVEILKPVGGEIIDGNPLTLAMPIILIAIGLLLLKTVNSSRINYLRNKL